MCSSPGLHNPQFSSPQSTKPLQETKKEKKKKRLLCLSMEFLCKFFLMLKRENVKVAPSGRIQSGIHKRKIKHEEE
jgi:hypothetical protein